VGEGGCRQERGCRKLPGEGKTAYRTPSGFAGSEKKKSIKATKKESSLQNVLLNADKDYLAKGKGCLLKEAEEKES